MGRIEGEGAGNLDYSSYTYEQLRAAVYGVNEEALRVAANEWADLKHRLNERVGTLSVELTKLGPAWNSPGGQQALKTLASQRDWMEELARVAGLNDDRMTGAQETYYKAVKAMQALDAEPDRPNPSPGKSPGSGDYVDPATTNWKQPPAAKIANYLYADLAIAAATMALPPVAPPSPIKPGSDPGEVLGNGPALPPGTGGSGGRPDSGSPQTDSSVSKTGGGEPGVVITNRTPGSSSLSGSQGPTGATSGKAPLVGVPTSAGDRSTVSGPATTGSGGRTGTGSVGKAPGAGLGGGKVISAPSGTAPAGGSPTVTDPGTKTLGGGLRPPPGTPVPPGSGGVPPGGMPHSGAGGGQDGRAGKKKPGYERGEPDTFRDTRGANMSGGEVRGAARGERFKPLPGMLGTQRQHAAQERAPWEVPEPAPVPEGFPDELRDFKRPDGTQFQVRRRGNAV